MQRVREEYADQYGDVENYTVVQTSSTVPMPFIMYFERDDAPPERVTEDSVSLDPPLIRFRLIPEDELSERESKVDGEETGKEMAGTLGKLFGGLGKGKKSPKEAASKAAMDRLAEHMAKMGKTIAQPGYRFKAQSLVDSLFWSGKLIDKMKFAYESAYTPPLNTPEGAKAPDPVPSTVLRADNPDIDIADFDPEMAAAGYKIITIMLEIANDPGDAPFFPLRMVTVIETPAGNRLRLHREYADFKLEGGRFVPKQTSYRMDGIQALVEGAHEFNTYTEIYSILDVMFNKGMPTAEERQQMLLKAVKTIEATMKYQEQ